MDIQTFLAATYTFIDEAVIPFLLTIAFLVFIWNIVQYFIIGGSNEESQGKARSHALWGIAAFVLILSFWGIINLFSSSLGFNTINSIIPDYMCDRLGGNCQEQGTPTPPAPLPGVPPGYNIPGTEGANCLPPLILTNGVCSNAPSTCAFPYYIKDGVCTGP